MGEEDKWPRNSLRLVTSHLGQRTSGHAEPSDWPVCLWGWGQVITQSGWPLCIGAQVAKQHLQLVTLLLGPMAICYTLHDPVGNFAFGLMFD